MDVIQNYISLLHALLPPSLTNPLIHLTTTTYGILRTLQTHLAPLLHQVITQPDIASVLALVAILWFSLQILGMAYRSIMFWVRLVFNVVKWAMIVGVSLWVWNRGAEGVAQDVKELAAYWGAQYQVLKGEAKAWKGAEEAQIRLQAAARARGW